MSVSTADISRVLDGVPKGLLINGKQVQTDATVKVEDPSTGELLAEVADATPGQGIDACEGAFLGGDQGDLAPADQLQCLDRQLPKSRLRDAPFVAPAARP